ncbi:isopeptide-forming domain-containing fimbrial protein [Bacillus cereus]|uniref:isopeptide-forming domain-containing fimbrial protein n=1 Tax=Bacillus cereus TaxID=1396 RepID=UPI003B5AC0A7
MQKYFGFKKYGKRFKQTIVSLLAFLLVFSGVAPSTVLQTVHAETASSTSTAVTQAKNKMLTYKFDNFSSGAVSQLFTLNDAAEVPGGANFIRLTPASTLKCGAAFTKNEICSKNNYSFSTAFAFKMSNPSPSGASDGLTFTIQGGTSSSHTNGGSLNFYGIKPSFTVKYDTFLNTDYRDPSANYIGLAKNGNPVNQPGWYTDLNQYNTNNGTNYALSNGTQYYTWIDYDGLSQNVQVLLGTSPDRASAKKVLDVGNINLGTIFNGQPYHAGFTASTGSPNSETHDINSWYFVNDYVPIETLNPNNDYKQAPSSVKVTTGPSDKPGVYDVTAILQDPLGNPVAGASLDNLTSTDGQLTGPNGESVTDLVSDADGKIHAVLKNFNHSKDTTVSATVGCATDFKMIPAANQPPTAPDDEKTISVNTNVSGQVKGTDPDGDSLTYRTGSKQPSHGTVVVNEDGTWTYTPSKDYVGDDSFTVMVDDGHGGTSEATIVIHVKPTPVLESKKEASIQQKADGNKDATHPEVGDTLLYKIQTRNTISDSPVKNAVIEDQLPAGLEYVPGTLQVDGKAMTDAEGDDNGHYIQGKVIGKLGDITDAEWHSVTFHAKVKADQAGKSIQNKATVTGEGVPPQEPTTTVEVSTPETPTPPANSCGQLGRVALVNGSFEEPYYTSIPYHGPGYFTAPVGTVPGWKTTDSYQVFEIFNKTLMDQIQPGSTEDRGGLKNPVAHGQQFAELNSREAAQLYQDVQTTPGQTIYWRLAHKGRQGLDTMAVKIGSSIVSPKDLPTIQQITTGKEQWKYYTGTYTVPAGQTATRFGFEAISSASGYNAAGNFLDDIFLGTEPCVSATKSVSPEGQVKTGDELTYNVTVKNDGGDVASNAVFTDAIPEGTEYVPGTIKVTKNAKTDSITDGKDTDSGYYQDGKVTVNLGDLPNTDILPDGVTVQFKVKVLSGYVNQQIKNKANVAYKNLLINKDQSVDTNEVVNTVILRDAKVESKKIAKNLQDKNTEVGDEIEYTIQMRNTVSDSIVKNAVIEDQLPEGLEYVPGTLQVNGKPVADTEGDDTGHYVQGKFTGQLGDITDTEWHTVVFHAKVKAGQAGQDIQNTAKVTGENVPPQEPSTTVEVYPRNPKVESKKTAKNLQDKNIEVGDEIEYTIQMRNTISDSVVKNTVIEDQLPEALEYVPGTLQVNGQSVTDAEGDDAGHYARGKVTGQLGDITDTEWHTVVFHAKVKAGQEGTAIQNIAKVTGEDVPPQEPTTEIKVQPLGQIEIEKVDAADSTIKLKNAVFQIIDKDGKEVGKLTTDENGKATSELLLLGKYTVKEIKAPDGYMLLKDPIEVEVSSPLQKITVENTKNGWNIPHTGGIGTTVFYLIGMIIMVAALVVFFRKRAKNK